MRELMLGAVPEPAILVLRGGEVLANGADCTAVEAAAAGHGPWPAGDLEAAIAMSIAENKAIVRRWSEELWSQGDLAVADEIVAPEYLRHDPGDPFPARGPQDVKRLVGMLRAMLPDLTIEVEDIVAEGDRVVSRYTAVATDTVGFMGRPPTGRVTRAAAMQMFRIANGQIVESWAVRDDLGVLRQLGHLPAPAAPS